MIITRTPFRISFFGGGSDYPDWYNTHPGSVLASAIDKYCYISCRRIPPFFDYRHSIVYSRREQVGSIEEISHPVVREVFRYMDVREGLEINHSADLPARSGIGSSSSFTVGLLHALHGLQGRLMSKKQLAVEAIHIEREVLKENVGSQDQMITAFGGLNIIDFSSTGIEITPVTIGHARRAELNSRLMLFFTRTTRIASEVAAAQLGRINDQKEEIRQMESMVKEAASMLGSGGNLSDFGRLLHESWQIKRSLSDRVTNSHIDSIYETARRAGAVGGKILGAGGGGFILFYAEPEFHAPIREALAALLYVPFHFDDTGSQIIYYADNDS